MKTGVSVLLGTRRFTWKPVQLEDGRVAWLRPVHELSHLCGMPPLYCGKPVRYTDRIPFCPPGIVPGIRINTIWMERDLRILIARFVIGWLVLVELLTVSLGWWFGYHPLLNGMRFPSGIVLYLPGQFVTWYRVVHPADAWLLDCASAASLLLAAILLALGSVQAYKLRNRGDTTRIASRREAKERFR